MQRNVGFIYDIGVSQHPLDPTKIFIQPRVSGVKAKESQDKMTVLRKQFVFVIDKSGSMDGTRIETVKNAVIETIERFLGNDDYFSVIAYNDDAEIVIEKDTKSSLTFQASKDKINAITAGGSTAIEKGLAAIGRQLKLEQNCQASIILLTDGQNEDKDITAKTMVNAIRRNLPHAPLPNIIPVGIGADYSPKLLKELGQETNIHTTVHITDPSKVSVKFSELTDLLGERSSEPVELSIQYGNQKKSCNLGSVFVSKTNSKVMEFDRVDQRAVAITHKHNDKDTVVYANLPEVIPTDKTILSYVARELLAEINQSDHFVGEMKEVKLQQEVLPLLAPIEDTDTADVISARQCIIDAIAMIREGNTNALLELTSASTMYSHYGTQTVYGGATANLKKYIPAIDLSKGELEINKQMYRLWQEETNFADPLIDRVISLDSDVIKREAILINLKSESLEQQVAMLPQQIKKPPTIYYGLLELARSVKSIFKSQHLEKFLEDHKNADVTIEIKMKEKNPNPQDYYPETQQCNLKGYFLDTFATHGTGLYRHVAPYTAALLGKLIIGKSFPKGLVRVFRALSATAPAKENASKVEFDKDAAMKKGLAYTWVIYKVEEGLSNGSYYLIDPLNKKNQIYNLSLPFDRALARADYASFGYEGIFDKFLRDRKLLSNDEFAGISESLLDLITDEHEDSFKQKGLWCPILLGVPKFPVRIKGQDPNHIFDRDSFVKCLAANSRNQCNPLTRQPCTEKDLIPAIGVRDEIVRMIAKSVNMSTTEGRPVKAVGRFQKKLGAVAERIRENSINGKIENGKAEIKPNEIENGKVQIVGITTKEEKKSEIEPPKQQEVIAPIMPVPSVTQPTIRQGQSLSIPSQPVPAGSNHEVPRSPLLRTFDTRLLRKVIKEMENYGIYLNDKEHAFVEAEGVARVVKKLNKAITEKLEGKPFTDARQIAAVQKDLEDIAKSEYEPMGHYRVNWNTLLINFGLAFLTGGFAIVGKLLYSYHYNERTQNGQLLFFNQKKQTTRQTHVDNVVYEINQLAVNR